MAKQSGGKPQIDEDFMKEIISQGLPVKKQEMPSVAVETPDKPDDKTGTVETEMRQNRIESLMSSPRESCHSTVFAIGFRTECPVYLWHRGSCRRNCNQRNIHSG